MLNRLIAESLNHLGGHGRTGRASLLCSTRDAGWDVGRIRRFTGLASQDLPTIRINPYGVNIIPAVPKFVALISVPELVEGCSYSLIRLFY